MKNDRSEAGLTQIQWEKIRKYCKKHNYKGSFLASETSDRVRAYVNHKPIEIYPLTNNKI